MDIDKSKTVQARQRLCYFDKNIATRVCQQTSLSSKLYCHQQLNETHDRQWPGWWAWASKVQCVWPDSYGIVILVSQNCVNCSKRHLSSGTRNVCIWKAFLEYVTWMVLERKEAILCHEGLFLNSQIQLFNVLSMPNATYLGVQYKELH